jgi:hypothetical protein
MMRRAAALQICFGLVQAFCLAPFQHIHSGHGDDQNYAGLIHAHFYHVFHQPSKSAGLQMDDEGDHASAKPLDTFTLAFAPALAPFILPRGPVVDPVSTIVCEPVEAVAACAHDPPAIDDRSNPRPPPA